MGAALDLLKDADSSIRFKTKILTEAATLRYPEREVGDFGYPMDTRK